MVFMEFEKPLEVMFEQLEQIKKISSDGSIDMTAQILELEKRKKTKSNEQRAKGKGE